ncbi:MAG: hypothetical protein ACXVLT_10160 [Flavisolibacter sp.]
MNKVTLAFPTHDSMWSFKGLSNGINVAVAPGKKTITGLFTSEEVRIAVIQFQAVHIIANTTNSVSFETELKEESRTSFKSRFFQLLFSRFLPTIRG